MDQPDLPADVVAAFGDVEVAAQLVEYVPPALDQRVTITVDALALAAARVDFAAMLVIRQGPRSVFIGHATEAGPGPSPTAPWIIVASRLATWATRKTGGLSLIPGTDRLEVMHQIIGTNDPEPARMDTPAWRPKPARFMVVVPIEGGLDPGSIVAGRVTVSTSTELPDQFRGLGLPDLAEAFREPGAWAGTIVDAPSIFGAEVAGIARISRVIDRLALASRYSTAASPSGELRPYRRDQSLERIRIRQIVGVRAIGEPRGWLRGYSYAQDTAPLRRSSLTGLGGFLDADDDELDQAAEAWRRSTVAESVPAAVLALGEAVELYARGARTPRPFSKAACRRIVQRATEGLDDAAAATVRRVLKDGLNRPPMLDRVRIALQADLVPISPGEMDVLEHVRDVRNGLLHGRPYRPIHHGSVLVAQAVVARILIYRLHRRADM